MKKYDIIILVLASEEERYMNVENNGIRQTWLKNTPENVKVLFYYAGHSIEKMVGDRLFLTNSEGFQNCGYKTISAFKYLKENNYQYKYILRTNISSYIDIKLLINHLDNKPTEKYYDGVIGDYMGIKFCSGSGYLISNDIVDCVLDNVDIWNHHYMDDVSLSIVLSKKGILPYGSPNTRFDITNDDFEIPINYYHYRCKDDSNPNGSRTIDINRMFKIFKLKMKSKENEI